MSFAFITPRPGQPGCPEWTHNEDGTPIRTIVEAALDDVCPVDTPAYTNTVIAVRSLEQWQETMAEAVDGHLEFHRRQLEAFDKAPLVG